MENAVTCGCTLCINEIFSRLFLPQHFRVHQVKIAESVLFIDFKPAGYRYVGTFITVFRQGFCAGLHLRTGAACPDLLLHGALPDVAK